MLQETKRKLCDKRFVGCVWKVRNKEWVVLPVCGASRRVRIIWDSNKFSYLEVVLESFLVIMKLCLDEEGHFGLPWFKVPISLV